MFENFCIFCPELCDTQGHLGGPPQGLPRDYLTNFARINILDADTECGNSKSETSHFVIPYQQNQQNGSQNQQDGSQNQQVLNPLKKVGSSQIDKGGRANYMYRAVLRLSSGQLKIYLQIQFLYQRFCSKRKIFFLPVASLTTANVGPKMTVVATLTAACLSTFSNGGK